MKYRNMYRWLILPLLFIMVVGLLFVGSACATPTRVTISPTSQTVAPEQTFTVDVRVGPVLAIAGAQFNLSFDPSLVTAISVDEGELFNQGGCATFFLPGTIDNDAGTITGAVCVITTPGCTVSNPGTLATITFVASETTGTSPLHLSNMVIGSKEGHALAKQVNDGSVTVSNP